MRHSMSFTFTTGMGEKSICALLFSPIRQTGRVSSSVMQRIPGPARQNVLWRERGVFVCGMTSCHSGFISGN